MTSLLIALTETQQWRMYVALWGLAVLILLLLIYLFGG